MVLLVFSRILLAGFITRILSKVLEAKNRQLEIENAFIKKLGELKGGGR